MISTISLASATRWMVSSEMRDTSFKLPCGSIYREGDSNCGTNSSGAHLTGLDAGLRARQGGGYSPRVGARDSAKRRSHRGSVLFSSPHFEERRGGRRGRV